MKSSVSDLPASGYYAYSYRDRRLGLNDGCIVWWKPNGYGYTNYLEDAGVFDEDFKSKADYPGLIFIPVEKVHAAMKTRTYVWEIDLDV